MTPANRAARMLVVAALLLAQQAALAHQYWHVSQAVVGVDAKIARA
jgi:hypothetical protein